MDAGSPLNVGNHLARVGLIPASVKVLGYHPELDDKVAGEIFGLDLAALFAPQPKQRILVVAHDNRRQSSADRQMLIPGSSRAPSETGGNVVTAERLAADTASTNFFYTANLSD